MYRVFISLFVALGLTGCGSLPLIGGGGAPAVDTGVKTELGANTPAEVEQPQSAAIPAAIEVPTPPVKSGNRALYDRALALLAEGQAAPAEVLLSEITESQPELAGPWLNIGLIQLSRGDEALAGESFKKAVEANPHNCHALNELGILARKQGDFAAAEDYYQTCLKGDPGFARAQLNLAILYELYMGRFPEALAAYQDYQLLLTEPNAKVNGWMADLERRVAAFAQR